MKQPNKPQKSQAKKTKNSNLKPTKSIEQIPQPKKAPQTKKKATNLQKTENQKIIAKKANNAHQKENLKSLNNKKNEGKKHQKQQEKGQKTEKNEKKEINQKKGKNEKKEKNQKNQKKEKKEVKENASNNTRQQGVRPDVEFVRHNQVKVLNQQLLDLCKAQKVQPPILAFERWRQRQKFDEQQFLDKEKSNIENLEFFDEFLPGKFRFDRTLDQSLKEAGIDEKTAERITIQIAKSTQKSIKKIQSVKQGEKFGKVQIYKQQLPVKKEKQQQQKDEKQNQKMEEEKEENEENLEEEEQQQEEIEYNTMYNVNFMPNANDSSSQRQLCSITEDSYEKLWNLFKKNTLEELGLDIQNEELMEKIKETQFHNYLYCLLARYKNFQGPGSQAAIPEKVFNVLKSEFEIDCECFASPMNCYFEDNYCSAFPDTDIPFGSKGNFFQISPKTGSFEANPPFAPEIMLSMVQHMEKLLKKSKEPLSFCVIVPVREEQKYWKQILASKYNQKQFILEKEKHVYVEGNQHEKKGFKKSPFRTGIIFLQNIEGKLKWPCTGKREQEIRKYFSAKHQ